MNATATETYKPRFVDVVVGAQSFMVDVRSPGYPGVYVEDVDEVVRKATCVLHEIAQAKATFAESVANTVAGIRANTERLTGELAAMDARIKALQDEYFLTAGRSYAPRPAELAEISVAVTLIRTELQMLAELEAALLA